MVEPTAVLSIQALIGAYVVNSQGKELGHLEELMVDIESGTVVYAVLFLGGLLGSDSAHFAIPWRALLVEDDAESVSLAITQESLKSARGSNSGEWPGASNSY